MGSETVRSSTGKLQGGQIPVPGHGALHRRKSNFFDAEPAEVMDQIKTLPKPEDLTDLQARMDCLLNENAKLRARVDKGDALRAENKELKDRMKEAEKEVKVAWTERDKSKEIAQKVCKFLGSPSDVLNKA